MVFFQRSAARSENFSSRRAIPPEVRAVEQRGRDEIVMGPGSKPPRIKRLKGGPRNHRKTMGKPWENHKMDGLCWKMGVNDG